MAIDPDVSVLLSALTVRIEALELSSQAPVDLTDLTAKVSALENIVNIPINPVTVIQTYEDGTEITYEKI